jgi:DNA-binding response OmpR family regulator
LLFLCNVVSDGHVAKALQSGADDHIGTTVDEAELAARVTALLRRNQLAGSLQSDIVRVGAWRLDGRRAICALNGSETRLTPHEFRLVRALALCQGHVLSHTELIERIWGSPYHGSTENLRKLVQRTRATLASRIGKRGAIEAVPGFGYRLLIDENADDNQ